MTCRNSYKHVGAYWNFFRTLLDDMIQTEVHFINCQQLLILPSHHRGIFHYTLAIIHFDASELGIFVAHVDAHNIEIYCMLLVRLQRRGNCHFLVFSVENVHEFHLFYSTDHACSSFWVCRYELPRYYSTHSGFTEGFLVDFDEFVAILVVLENHYATTIRSQNYIVFFESRQSESLYCSYHSEDFR